LAEPRSACAFNAAFVKTRLELFICPSPHAHAEQR
jgi:hypothetical protein